eukprot:m51a1_g12469 hypothetical protein (428) ;mRNA; f:63-1852
MRAVQRRIEELPPSVDALQELRVLVLAQNRLQSVPLELGRLFRLERLDLSGNPLVSLPPSVLAEGTRSIVAHLRDRLQPMEVNLQRKWVAAEQGSMPSPGRATVRVMTFNVLAEGFASAEQYPYCPSWALDASYRYQRILAEIASCGPDIACLQEVQSAAYADFFLPSLAEMGYAGVFRPRSKARTMPDWSGVDGCAVFYRQACVRLLQEHLVEYQRVAMARFRGLQGDLAGLDKLIVRDNIALVALFQVLSDGKAPRFLLVADTHIHWDPQNCDVKLMQVQFMLEELAAIKAQAERELGVSVAVAIMGDFNATPQSGVYQLLRDGSVPPDHPEFNGSNFGTYTTSGLHHSFNLVSSYAHLGEPEYTNYSGDFVGVLDYIWVSRASVRVLQALNVVPMQELQLLKSPLPNAHFPSDHVSLVAEFELR